jgi:hypothetical protein
MKKANIDKLMREIYKFEKKAGFDKTPRKQLIKWLKKEVMLYEKANKKQLKENKLSDILVLVMQLSRRDKISMDKALSEHMKKSEKYLK